MRHGFIKVAAVTPEVRVADCEFNGTKIIGLIESAAEEGIHLLVLPELCVTGYTCGDLFFQQALLDNAKDWTLKISAKVPRNMVVVFGAPVEFRGKIHNCAVVASAGKILGLVPKINIPNYLEHYEARWFAPALPHEEYVDYGDFRVPMGRKLIFTCNQLPDFRLACEVCEDLWVPNPPSVEHTINGATVIANISASDEFAGKKEYRRRLVEGQSARLVCGYIYANAGKGESTTDVVFTGNDLICENGYCVASHSMKEDVLLATEIDVQRLCHERLVKNTFVTTNDKEYSYIGFDIEMGETQLTRHYEMLPFVPEDPKDMETRAEEILGLQAAGLESRMTHIRSKAAVIGISGGLDSTLALLVAARAFDSMGYNRSNIVCVTMPCFGTTERTKNNAGELVKELGATLMTVDIKNTVLSHFEDIGQDPNKFDVTFENAQARERTQVLMDLGNKMNAIVIGTGDLSELALGWATFNGDHMSNYGVNAGVPKTLVRSLVRHEAEKSGNGRLKEILLSIIDTPISPELIPGKQETEDLVGPYELHDFFIYHTLRWGSSPSKVFRLAKYAFAGRYDSATIAKWLDTFYSRFFAQQFKRSCLPDGPKVGSVSLSPRGDWRMPSDASSRTWRAELRAELEE